ncbi:MAG: AsmA family protein [Pseudomonadota bacterium]
MRLLKWLLGLVVVVVVLIAGALFYVAAVFDPNDHRDRIIAAVEEQTGRDFDLSGDLSLTVFPTLAFEAGPASLGNDPAFEGREFLQANRIAAAVDLVPLMSNELRVGEIVLDGVAINLAIDENGRGNWESLVDATATGAGTGDSPDAPDGTSVTIESPPLDLSVEALRLIDASIRFTDASTGTAASLEDLDISIAPVASDQPTQLDFSTRYAYDEYAGTVSAVLVAEALLAEAGPRLALESFEIVNEQGIDVTVTSSQPATVDLAAGTASLPGLEVRSGDARIVLSADATDMQGTPAVSGTLTVDPFDVGAWLADSGFYDAGTADPTAMKRLGVDAAFNLRGSTFTLASLTAQLDDSTLTGQASVGDRIEFDLEVDTLNVDRYLPPATDEEAPVEAGGSEPIAPPELPALNGSMRVGQFIVAGLEATDIELQIAADADGIAVEPVRGGLYGGAVNAAVRVDTGTQPGRTTVDLDVTDVSAGPMLTALLDQQVLTGTGALSASLALEDAFAADPVPGLGGNVSLSLTDGALYGINVIGTLRKGLALIGKGDPALLDEGDRTTDFSSFVFAGDIDAGVLESKVFELASPYLRVNGAGTVDVARQTLDYRLEPILIGAPEGQGSELAELEGTRVPVALSGSFAAPEVDVDIATALLSSQQGRIENAILDKLGVETDDEEEEDLGQSLLRGLLQKAGEKDKDDDSDNGGSE